MLLDGNEFSNGLNLFERLTGLICLILTSLTAGKSTFALFKVWRFWSSVKMLPSDIRCVMLKCKLRTLVFLILIYEEGNRMIPNLYNLYCNLL
jgi:hypothetical protein